MIHELKCWPEYFQAMSDGLKTFDVRVNDRDFQVGDILIQKEYHPGVNTYSGHALAQKVTYVLYGGKWGIPEHLAVMSIVNMDYDSVIAEIPQEVILPIGLITDNKKIKQSPFTAQSVVTEETQK